MKTYSCLTLSNSVNSRKLDMCFTAKIRSYPLNLGPFLNKYSSEGRRFGKLESSAKSRHAYLETIEETFEVPISLMKVLASGLSP